MWGLAELEACFEVLDHPGRKCEHLLYLAPCTSRTRKQGYETERHNSNAGPWRGLSTLYGAGPSTVPSGLYLTPSLVVSLAPEPYEEPFMLGHSHRLLEMKFHHFYH